jgi:Arc/MetJ-type ribon-helix-helix transcriptional regulator
MKTISLQLPDDVDCELSARAKRTGTSKSSLIRQAIKNLLSQVSDGRKDSSPELPGDPIGCAKGLGDLLVRAIRDAIYEETKACSREELKAFFAREAAAMRKESQEFGLGVRPEGGDESP